MNIRPKARKAFPDLPPLDSAIVKQVAAESARRTSARWASSRKVSMATDDEGLLIDQHVAHERILFEARALESSRRPESQHS